MEKNYLTLHRSPDRQSIFGPQRSQPPFFDPLTNAWIIVEPGRCERLPASRDARPATYSEDCVALKHRQGFDFSNAIFAFAHLPLCLHGDEHRRTRRRVAEHLTACKAEVEARIVTATEEHLGILRQAGDVEAMRQVLEPLVLSVMEPITGLAPFRAADCRAASTIFDKSIGLRKRQRVETELGRLREHISSRFGPDISQEEEGFRLALLVVGHDALLGTLGESLRWVVAENPGRRLDEIRYPDVPPETGVPFIERIVTKSFADEDMTFNVGDRLRIYLQPFAYSGSARERARMFWRRRSYVPGEIPVPQPVGVNDRLFGHDSPGSLGACLFASNR